MNDGKTDAIIDALELLVADLRAGKRKVTRMYWHAEIVEDLEAMQKTPQYRCYRNTGRVDMSIDTVGDYQVKEWT